MIVNVYDKYGKNKPRDLEAGFYNIGKKTISHWIYFWASRDWVVEITIDV